MTLVIIKKSPVLPHWSSVSFKSYNFVTFTVDLIVNAEFVR